MPNPSEYLLVVGQICHAANGGHNNLGSLPTIHPADARQVNTAYLRSLLRPRVLVPTPRRVLRNKRAAILDLSQEAVQSTCANPSPRSQQPESQKPKVETHVIVQSNSANAVQAQSQVATLTENQSRSQPGAQPTRAIPQLGSPPTIVHRGTKRRRSPWDKVYNEEPQRKRARFFSPTTDKEDKENKEATTKRLASLKYLVEQLTQPREDSSDSNGDLRENSNSDKGNPAPLPEARKHAVFESKANEHEQQPVQSRKRSHEDLSETDSDLPLTQGRKKRRVSPEPQEPTSHLDDSEPEGAESDDNESEDHSGHEDALRQGGRRCITCRKSKKGCYGKYPICQRCERQELQCIWQDAYEDAKKMPPPKHPRRVLQRRQARDEADAPLPKKQRIAPVAADTNSQSTDARVGAAEAALPEPETTAKHARVDWHTLNDDLLQSLTSEYKSDLLPAYCDAVRTLLDEVSPGNPADCQWAMDHVTKFVDGYWAEAYSEPDLFGEPTLEVRQLDWVIGFKVLRMLDWDLFKAQTVYWSDASDLVRRYDELEPRELTSHYSSQYMKREVDVARWANFEIHPFKIDYRTGINQIFAFDFDAITNLTVRDVVEELDRKYKVRVTRSFLPSLTEIVTECVDYDEQAALRMVKVVWGFVVKMQMGLRPRVTRNQEYLAHLNHKPIPSSEIEAECFYVALRCLRMCMWNQNKAARAWKQWDWQRWINAVDEHKDAKAEWCERNEVTEWHLSQAWLAGKSVDEHLGRGEDWRRTKRGGAKR